jgi:hypothetical protein
MTAPSGDPRFLSRFPKTRPPLSPRLAAIYKDHYRMNREGCSPASSLSRAMESWLHREVARDVATGGQPRSTLELGAGTLNQLDFEPQVGPYDIVEPFEELYRGSPHLQRIRHVFADIGELPPGARYDRVISVATLEHLCDLPRVVATAALLLEPGGEFRAAIPSEGTLLWTLAWRLTTGVEFWLRHRADYGELMRHEHVNDAREIEEVLEFCFENVTSRAFGLGPSLSLYRSFACTRPHLARCQALRSGSPSR